MSSNTPFIDSTEDNTQKKTMTKNRVPPEDKSGSASIEAEKQTKISKKRSEPSWDKSGSSTQTETERTEKQDIKKRSVQLYSSNDNKLQEQEPKDMSIKIPQTTRDDKSFSSMSQ